MSSVVSISEHIERQSVQVMECTIPGDLTIDEWRRRRRRQPRPAQSRGHLHDTTARSDHEPRLREAA